MDPIERAKGVRRDFHPSDAPADVIISRIPAVSLSTAERTFACALPVSRTHAHKRTHTRQVLRHAQITRACAATLSPTHTQSLPHLAQLSLSLCVSNTHMLTHSPPPRLVLINGKTPGTIVCSFSAHGPCGIDAGHLEGVTLD